MKTKTAKNKKLKIAVISVVLAALVCVGVVWAVITLRAQASFKVQTIKHTAETTISYATGTSDLTFTKPAQSKEVNVVTENKTASVLRCYYTLSLDTSKKDSDGNALTSDTNLQKAILVYFNGDYQGTLAEILDTSTGTKEFDGCYVAGYVSDTTANTTAPSVTDTFKFELHNGADGSVYDGKNVYLTVTAYTETADYENKIYVKTADDLAAAIQDINSGVDSGLISSKAEVVLVGDFKFPSDATVTNPLIINLNGHTLSGSVTVNAADAYVWCKGKGTTSGVSVTLTSYDSETLNALLIAEAKSTLANGVAAGESVSLFGVNTYYASAVTISSTENNYTYSGRSVTASAVTRTTVEKITVCGTEIEFKILDTDSADGFAATYLKNVNAIVDTDVTCDLFLPTSIKAAGATIEWTSSDTSIMDNTGRITADYADKKLVTLYATISVNGNVTTASFSFTVSAHTRAINFYKLVANMSPVVMYEIGNKSTDSDSNDTSTGIYQLPIVGTSGTAPDYRTSYTTPSKSSLWTSVTDETGEGGANRLYSYAGNADITGLKGITYSTLTTETTNTDSNTTTSETYNYITLSGSQVWLNQSTIQKYAKVHVTGTFDDDYTVETDVYLIVAIGTDTTVFDETLTVLNEEFEQINVLKSILASRVTNGVGGETASFTLRSTYTATTGEQFTITYQSSNDTNITISATTTKVKVNEGTDDEETYDAYTVTVDPSIFDNAETKTYITATISYSGTTRESNLYFTLPAAVHTEDFDGDASLFNSVKAQVIQQLPSAETTKSTGFESNYTINNTGDYILVRDIIGDTEYKKEYTWYGNSNDYIYTDYYSTSDGFTDEDGKRYEGCTELWLYTSSGTESTDYTDSTARDFAALIEWATGDDKGTAASEVVKNSSNLGNYASNTSDGKEYLDDNEVNVLKTYYENATVKTDWDTVFATVSEKKDGYVFTDTAGEYTDGTVTTVATVAKTYLNSGEYALKYNSILQWATNFRNNEYNPSTTPGFYVDGVTVAPENVNVELASVTYTSTAPSESNTITINDTRSYTTHNGTTGTAEHSSDEYTCFYVDEINKRAWYYRQYSLSSNIDHKYNVTSYTVNSWSMNSGTAVNTATNGEYTLEDFSYGSYLDDDTEYITAAEAQVLFAFWVRYETTTNTCNTERAKEYIEAFYANTVIPTYLTNDGAKNLMSDFYTAKGLTADGTTSPFTTASVDTSADSGLVVTDKKVSYAPVVASCEALSDALSYFTNLQQLYIQGTAAKPAFLSEYGLNTAGSHLRANCAKTIETLVLEHVAENYVSYSLSGIKNYTALTQIDVSDNKNITNVAPLINNVSDQYTYIDISNLGLGEKSYEYVATNAATTTTVYYGDTGGNPAVTSKSGSGVTTLANLSDFEQLLSENMYAVTTTTDNSTVYYRIEEGNEMIAVSGADVSATTLEKSADEMQLVVSPYYYCTEDFTYSYTDSNGDTKPFSFVAGRVYKITYDTSGNVSAIDSAFTTNVYSNVEGCTNLEVNETTSGKTTAETVESQENPFKFSTTDNTSSSNTTIYSTSISYSDGTNTENCNVTFNCVRFKKDKSTEAYLCVGEDGSVSVVSDATKKGTRACIIKTEDIDALLAYLNHNVGTATKDYLTNNNLSSLDIGINLDDITDESNKEYELYIYFPETDYTLKMTCANSEYALSAVAVTIPESTGTELTSTAVMKFFYTFQAENKCRFNFKYYSDPTDTATCTTVNVKISGVKDGLSYSVDGTNNVYYYQVDTVTLTATLTDSSKNSFTATKWTTTTDDDGNETTTGETETVSSSAVSGVVSFGWEVVKTVTTYTLTQTASVKANNEKNTVPTYTDESDTTLTVNGNWCEVNTTITTTSYDNKETITCYTTYKDCVLTTPQSRTGVTRTVTTYTCRVWYYVGSTKYTVDSTSGISSVSDGTHTIYLGTGTSSDTSTTVYAQTAFISYVEEKLSGGSWDDEKTTYTVTGNDQYSGDVTGWGEWTVRKNGGSITSSTTPYYNYISGISKSSHAALEETYNYYTNKNGNFYQYTQTEATKTQYMKEVGTSTTYKENGYYMIAFSNGTPIWRETYSENMSGLLETANKHFGDLQYGEYYGTYVAYLGTSTSDYTHGTIYRIMPNADNSAFIYVTANIATSTTTTTTTGYYYCTKAFAYGDCTFAANTLYKVTFDSDGNVTAKENATYNDNGITNIEGSISKTVEHTGIDGGYTKSTEKQTETKTITRTLTTTLTYNYFILTNGGSSGYALFSSGNSTAIKAVKILTDFTTYNSSQGWNTLDPTKVSFLTEEEYNIVKGTTGTNKTTVGVSSVNELACSTLTYGDSGWTISGTPTAYYLYFPKLRWYAHTLSESSVVASQSSATAYYVCRYNTGGTYLYLLYATTDTNTTDVAGIDFIGMSGTSVQGVSCISDNNFNTYAAWTISDSTTITSSSSNSSISGTVKSSGTYTGDTTTKNIDVTVTTSSSESTITAKSLTYVVTKSGSGYHYTKTVYAFNDGKVYQVTYEYTDLTSGYETGTVEYSYVDSKGNTQPLSEVTGITYVLDGVTYTFAHTNEETNAESEQTYVDNITTISVIDDTVISLSDSAQFTADFGMDSGTFYDNDYSLSGVMKNITADSWGDLNGDGKDDTNADMEGKIVYITKGTGSDQYIETGFYEIVYSESMASYSIKAVQVIDYEALNTTSTDENGETVTTYTGLVKFTNCRIQTVLKSVYGWNEYSYLGTGGTYTIEVTAFTHTDTDNDGKYVDVERTYVIEVVG